MEISQLAGRGDRLTELLANVPEAKRNPYPPRLRLLFQEMAMWALQGAGDAVAAEVLREALSIIYRAADEVREMRGFLRRTVPGWLSLDPGVQMEQLGEALERRLLALTPAIARLFGLHEARFIVTPGYQAGLGQA